MAFDASSRKVLLLHDGDLSDLRAVVERIGAQVVEAADEANGWDVAIVTARRLRDLARGKGRPRAVRIAVLDRDARTLRALCKRSGIDLVVLRPVHPTALRLLLLHALYRGPERRTRRVAVGAPVRFRAGLRRRDAVLADLSARGCLLLSRDVLAIGKRLTVYLTDAGGRIFAIGGRVVRVVAPAPGDASGSGFAVAFAALSRRNAVRLKDAVALHLEGPPALARDRSAPLAAPASAAAVASDALPDDPEGQTLRALPDDPEGQTLRALPAPDETAPAIAPVEVVDGAPEPADMPPPPLPHFDEIDLAERRRSPRRPLPGRRVVALGEEAARVLIGRDLSAGGMRVEPGSGLELGRQLRLALHVSAGETPLVVEAEVIRDDGPSGHVLRFSGLDESAARYLAKMVDSLPVLDAGSSSAGGVVVTEIVEGPA